MKNAARYTVGTTIFAILIIVVGFVIWDARQEKCQLNFFLREIPLKDKEFSAILNANFPGFFWVDGCRNAYLLRQASLSDIENINDIAERNGGSAAVTGTLSGNIIDDKTGNANLYVSKFTSIHVMNKSFEDNLEERLRTGR